MLGPQLRSWPLQSLLSPESEVLYTHGRVTETGRPFTENAALVVCVEVKVTVDRETFWKATIAVGKCIVSSFTHT